MPSGKLAWKLEIHHKQLNIVLLFICLFVCLFVYNQSWTGKWGKGVPEPQIILGEEAGPVCPGEAAQSGETLPSKKTAVIT